MITRFHVENYKALRDVTLDLTPIHLLIGPSDTGKSSILEALAALGRIVHANPLTAAFGDQWEGRQLVEVSAAQSEVLFEVVLVEDDSPIRYRITCRFAEEGREVRPVQEAVAFVSGTIRRDVTFPAASTQNLSGLMLVVESRETGRSDYAVARQVHDYLMSFRSYRWHPAHLALPVAADFAPRFGMEETGFGLAMCLDDLLGNHRDRFLELQERLRGLFPDIRGIILRRQPGFSSGRGPWQEAPGKGLFFELAGGIIPACQAAQSVLVTLAYLALRFAPNAPRLLLLEQPDNGLHPARLPDVLRILVELAEGEGRTQVLMTTCSPFVVDQFHAEEVTLCRRGPDGAVTTLGLARSRKVHEHPPDARLGQLWLSIGDDALAEPAESGP